MKSVRKAVKDNLGFLANNNSDDDGVLTLGAVELVEAARERIFALQEEERRWRKKEQELRNEIEKAKNFGKTQSRIAESNYADKFKLLERLNCYRKKPLDWAIMELQDNIFNIKKPFDSITPKELSSYSADEKYELMLSLKRLLIRLDGANYLADNEDEDGPIVIKGVPIAMPIVKDKEEDFEWAL